VPLPGSLTQFFPGGGTVAGGGGSLAGSLLLKGAVVLVAGAVVTGVGSRRVVPAVAAPEPSQAVQLAVAPTTPTTPTNAARPVPKAEADRPQAAHRAAAVTQDAPAAAAPRHATAPPAVRSEGAAPKAPPAPRRQIPLPPPVEDVTSSVQQAVGNVTGELPVQVPSLPPVPDPPRLPPLPPPPPLPPLP
jgi:hypothetical protein